MGVRSSSIIKGIIVRFFAAVTVIFAVAIGIGLGLSLSETTNIKNEENFFDFAPALPTKILDINGTVITEFSADEKRALVSLNDLPRHLIHAVLAREDPDFYSHKGFSVRGITRALVGRITGNNLGGGSTITQQIAGTLYTDRREMTLSRKVKELWWALQMERRFTKNEILEIYLNQINTGPGVYGVEAASQYFFGHSVKDITLAESAVLVVLFSSPTRYNPLSNPNEARDRQWTVLDKMISMGYTTREEAEASFNDYWDNYDYTRASTAAYFNRTDAAPWFSELVRRELDVNLYGSTDYYRDGYTVHTTLNLKHQDAAARQMDAALARANVEYSRLSGSRLLEAERTWIPLTDLLSLYFDLGQIHTNADVQNRQKALNSYATVLNPVVDLASLAFGIPDLKPVTVKGYEYVRTAMQENVVEGALVSIENDTGHITAIIGGSKFDENNQLIRAVQGNLQPGSSFKPLYYSAAIDSGKFTAATLLSNIPVVFYNEDGTPYMPNNYMGRWSGSLLLYDALIRSLNVPAVRILDGIGFDAAIDRAAALLDYDNPDEIRRRFPRVYPLGLGINTTSPLKMARAFSIFANQGREVTPIAIRSVEDRNGKVLLDIERDIRLDQRRRGNAAQVISPQNAYIMTTILRKVIDRPGGTLYGISGYGSKFAYKDENGKTFRMPMAGKTGTPQNWSDAWTLGYSPYYTTAVWFGFDKPGNSLGMGLTGETLAGPVWVEYMREIHQELPFRDFVRPATGIVDVTVCAKTGLLLTAACNEGAITLPFIEGTQPTRRCEEHGNNTRKETSLNNIELDGIFMDTDDITGGLSMPVINDENLMRELRNEQRRDSRRTVTPGSRIPGGSYPLDGFSNPLLDDLPPSSPASNSGDTGAPVDSPEENPGAADFDSLLETPFYNPLLD